MKIKIIANKPLENKELCSDISSLIGKKFNVLSIDKNNYVEIFADGYGIITIFPGEYEIIK